MITGDTKNRIDSIWDTFWTGGITNSITILEQMTYLFFMKMLDDAQRTKEANANAFGVAVKEPTFKQGMWHNPDTDRDACPITICGGASSRTRNPKQCSVSLVGMLSFSLRH